VSAEDEAASAIASWFRRSFAKCAFAAHLANQGDILVSAMGEPENDPAQVGASFDAAAEAQQVGVVVFPRFRTADDVARLLAKLREDVRWNVERRAWRGQQQPDALPLSIGFRTTGGLVSDVMGLGPIGTMPVTRRAPYAALVAWAGGSSNPFMKAPPDGSIGFVNVRATEDRELYDALMEKSNDLTAAAFADPPEDAVWLRKVAFILPTTAVARYLPDLVAQPPD
jgi:hypothetical protein